MESNIEIALSLFKKNKYQETIDKCNQLLKTDNNSLEAIKLTAKAYLAIRRVYDARLYLNKALSINPEDYEAIKDLGNSYKAVRDINNAKKYYQKALEINSSFAPALNNLASIELKEGNKEYSLSLLIKATASDPELAIAWGNLANCYVQLGKTQEAENICKKAIEIDPNQYDFHFLMGSIQLERKKPKEAELSISKAIALNPNLYKSHFLLGKIKSDLGKSQEAEISYRNAIKLNPNLAIAHYNLGIILQDLGNLQEAEISYRHAIKLNPEHSKAYSNLGNILRDIGKPKEAENACRKAIEINPNFTEAHLSLGNIFRDFGKNEEAFECYLKTIELNPNYHNIYSHITRFLRDINPSKLNKYKLRIILNVLLEKKDIAHQELFKVFSFLCKDEIIIIQEQIEYDFSKIELLDKDKILINSLKKIIFQDIVLEKSLTKLRKKLCDKISNNKKEIINSQLQFIIALGEQCFLNEYIYSISEEESICINKIINDCKDGGLNEAKISILSCYFPLYKLLEKIPSLTSFNSSNKSIKELFELQILEPLQEIELSKSIKKIGSINDSISQKVKAQYEENPYPRWRYESHAKKQKISISKAINSEIKPNTINLNFDNRKLKIFIAGCGTGNQILLSQKYNNANITAIDLSLTSLSYAQRKINELGIDNVELIQMDILEVGLLKEKFDIIECGGVLHHMENPLEGLKKLLDILKPTGFLKLALYSELARKDVIKAKEYISRKKLNSSKTDIQFFREDIISGNFPEFESIKQISDFYSTSQCRDLCFHAQEHRFTINQLLETLKSYKLKFLGFLLPQSIKSLYESYFPEDKTQTNLLNWAKFEEKHPNTFREMYQFWVCKTKN